MIQLTLPNVAQFMGKFRRKLAKLPTPAAPQGKQLRLKLYLRKLYRIAGIGFIWTRPDGRQFRCRTMRQLVTRIMDYDGHLLHGVLRLA